MKKTFLRLPALVLALIMLLTALVGCNNPGEKPDNGGGGNNGDSSVTEPIQITTTVYEIAKHGNLILYMYGSELFENGFEHGDVVEISIGDKKLEAPLCTSYSDVDNGKTVLRATSATDGVVLAINMGDLATTFGIARKTAIEEDPGYRWDYLIETPAELTITMKEEGGYRDEWLIRQLVRTNERADYSHLGDEAFANFRVISTTGMGANVLYRSSSPINPALGRNTYADKAAEKAGIITVINLADPSNTYEGTENTYYSTCKVSYVNLGTDFLSEATLGGLAEGMRFIINNDGPYLIHCNEGKDRAGFVSALLECLMGATLEEVIDDYMLTYYNYYGVEEGTEKYNAVVKNNLIKVLNTTFKVSDVYKADLVREAEEFLMEDVGLSADELAALKGKLTITLRGVYEAGKNLSALLGEHESVYYEVVSGGKVIEEAYFSKQVTYIYYGPEFMNLGYDFAYFITESAEYYRLDGIYEQSITLKPSGIIDMTQYLASSGSTTFLSQTILNDEATVTVKDGLIIVRCIAGLDEIYVDEDVISCVETYTLDAKSREIVEVKTVYTHKDGTVDEGVVTITRDVPIPDSADQFLEYANETENMRTVTIVSNPGTESEKTESVQVPKGLQFTLSIDLDVEGGMTLYADAACTETFEQERDVNSDITIYVKWSE
ncbi:MAG: tyrosine-protein phosphatase [Clostridia bacterium]|nr:tyrosine-protein phosphatase [Clostridia bacterium]